MIIFLFFVSIFAKRCYIEDNSSVSEIVRNLSLYGLKNETNLQKLKDMFKNITYDTNVTDTIKCKDKFSKRYFKYKEISNLKHTYNILSGAIKENFFNFTNRPRKGKRNFNKKKETIKKKNFEFWNNIFKKIKSSDIHNYNDFVYNQKKFKGEKEKHSDVLDKNVYFEYLKNVFSTDTENIKKIDKFFNVFSERINKIHNFAHKYKNMKKKQKKEFFFESFLNVESEIPTEDDSWSGYGKNDITSFDLFSISDYKNYLTWHYNWLFCTNGFGNAFDCKACFPNFQIPSYGCKEILFKEQNLTLLADDLSTCADYESFLNYIYLIFFLIYNPVVSYLFSQSTFPLFKLIYASVNNTISLSKESVICLFLYSSNVFILIIVLLIISPFLLTVIITCVLSENDENETVEENNEKITKNTDFDEKMMKEMIKKVVSDLEKENKKKEISALNYYDNFIERKEKDV